MQQILKVREMEAHEQQIIQSLSHLDLGGDGDQAPGEEDIMMVIVDEELLEESGESIGTIADESSATPAAAHSHVVAASIHYDDDVGDLVECGTKQKMYFVEGLGLPVPTWTFGGGKLLEECMNSEVAYKTIYQGASCSDDDSLACFDDDDDDDDGEDSEIVNSLQIGFRRGYKELYQNLEYLTVQAAPLDSRPVVIPEAEKQSRINSPDDGGDNDGGGAATFYKQDFNAESSFVEDSGLLVPTWTF
jgi:hypothetical protein